MNGKAKLRGWLVSRCCPPLVPGTPALPALVRDLIRRAFESLSGPDAEDGPIKWGLCDCEVNGRASMAICAVIDGVAVPVFVVPVPGLLLRNGHGDALAIERHQLLGADPTSKVGQSLAASRGRLH